MGDISAISWTAKPRQDGQLEPGATWPIVTGCDKVSAGCLHCYAIRDAWRMGHNPNPKISGVYAGLAEKHEDGSLHWTGVVRYVRERLGWPLRKTRGRRWFTTSQADLHHQDVSWEALDEVYAVMAVANWHEFQVLTKRHQQLEAYHLHPETPARIERALFRLIDEGIIGRHKGKPIGFPRTPRQLVQEMYGHIWLGVSAENQRWFNRRVPSLVRSPGAYHFLSLEPQLDVISLEPLFDLMRAQEPAQRTPTLIITGGESGSEARPYDPSWAGSLISEVRRAQDEGLPVRIHVKQLGQRWAQTQQSSSIHGADPVFWPEELRVQETF